MRSVIIKLHDKQISLDALLVPFFVKPLFVLFIYFGMFSRSSGIGGLTGGMMAVLISAALFGTTLLHMIINHKRPGFSVLAYLVILFFLIAATTPLLSVLVYNERMMHVLRYVIELGICFAIFYSIYYFVREGLITPKFIIYTFALTGILASLQLIVNITNSENYQRLRGLGGLNYLGNTFAVSSLSYVMILYARDFRSWTKIAMVGSFLLVFLTLILTGTRAGFLAFLGGLFLYQVFGIKSRRFTNYVIVFTVIIGILITVVSLQVDLTRLFERYNYENLSRMAMIRFDLYYGAVADLTLAEFLIGRADLAALSERIDVDRFVNPHNVFLSLIRFNGILPFLVFFTILLILAINYFKVYKVHEKIHRFRVMESTMIIFLAMSFLNVMVSGGAFTRNFFLFFMIGYIVGYIDLIKSNPSVKRYNEMIL